MRPWKSLLERAEKAEARVKELECQKNALQQVNATAEAENERLREALRGIVQWTDPCWTGGYAGDPKTPHPAWGDVQEGRAALKVTP